MRVKVRFVVDRRTGEVDVVIEDEGSTLPREEHDRTHDRIAAEIGRVMERDPRVDEILPGSAVSPPPAEQQPAPEVEDQDRDVRRDDARRQRN